MKRTVILIGAAPTIGKSSMAKRLSRDLGLPWFSTDQVREIMRAAADEGSNPHLFNAGHDTAESYYSAFDAAQTCEMEFVQGYATWPGVMKLIDIDYMWKDGFILEGVNILPDLVKKHYHEHPHVKAVFLVDRDIERTRKVIHERGLWGDPETYSDDIKEIELEWVRMYNQQMEELAHQHGQTVVEVTKNIDKDSAKVKRALDIVK